MFTSPIILLTFEFNVPCTVVSVYGSKTQDIKKKYSENFIENFIGGACESYIKLIGILLLIARFIKSSDQGLRCPLILPESVPSIINVGRVDESFNFLSIIIVYKGLFEKS